MAACDFGEFVHGFLHDAGNGGVVGVDRFAHLEVDIRILRGAAQDGMLRGEGTCSMGTDQVIVHAGGGVLHPSIWKILVTSCEVRNPSKKCRKGTRDLSVAACAMAAKSCASCTERGGEQRPACLADSHHILMIAVNGKGVRGDGARGNMEDRAGEFTRDLVHVGDHQQQTL